MMSGIILMYTAHACIKKKEHVAISKKTQVTWISCSTMSYINFLLFHFSSLGYRNIRAIDDFLEVIRRRKKQLHAALCISVIIDWNHLKHWVNLRYFSEKANKNRNCVYSRLLITNTRSSKHIKNLLSSKQIACNNHLSVFVHTHIYVYQSCIVYIWVMYYIVDVNEESVCVRIRLLLDFWCELFARRLIRGHSVTKIQWINDRISTNAILFSLNWSPRVMSIIM